MIEQEASRPTERCETAAGTAGRRNGGSIDGAPGGSIDGAPGGAAGKR
ncbi:hypothetical protein DM2_187 [Halorubrum sp. DM2]|nr:hypothetical protein DM2_187 [Halorubrum sp. DM2]